MGGTGQSWATAFSKIREAINSSAAHDEIWVAAGVYQENLLLHEGIILFGGFSGVETNRSERDWNIHSTVIDGRNLGPVLNLPFHTSIPTRLDGFVIQKGRADFGAGIYSAGGEFISANNLIIHNSGDGIFGGGGLFVDETAQLANGSPITFFTNVASQLLRLHSPGLSAERIQVFPTNCYSPEVHRLLQLAANIYDATTNRGSSYPFYPSVFRPLFTNESGNIFISGYVEASNTNFLENQWLDVSTPADRQLLSNPSIASNANIYGQPITIGTKKGFPNFNEFSMETISQITRSLELRKPTTNSISNETNQMYSLMFSNVFGVETWNSYPQIFARPLELHVSHKFAAWITDETGATIWPTSGVCFTTNFSPVPMIVSNWPGFFLSSSNSFVLPYFTNIFTLPLSQYLSASPHFQIAPSSVGFERFVGFPVPQWKLHLKNRIQYWATDAERVVDFVNLGEQVTEIDLTRELFDPFLYSSPVIAGMWATNRLNGSINSGVPTLGILKQMVVALGQIAVNDSDWYSFNATAGPNKDQAISVFRKFMGFTPFPPYQNIPMPTNLTMQAPFAPTLKIYHRASVGANDPIIHFLLEDLKDETLSSVTLAMVPPSSPQPNSNLRRLNERYRPYGFSADYSYDPSFEDEGIHHSRDWDFPTNNLFNLQWLDRVHRGTPWQTIYTGFDSSLLNNAKMAEWLVWSGSRETYPTNDWKIAELLLNERANLGTTVSNGSPAFVNNTFAANTGINGAAASFAGPASFVNNIVAENSSGLFRLSTTNEVIFQTNCVFNNVHYNFLNLSGGSGNIAASPQFVSAGTDNFHLLATSPCIDGGSADAFTSGWLLNDSARMQGAGIDLGAFELSSLDSPVVTSPTISPVSNQFTFQVTGFTGERYVVEISNDLIQWMPLSTNVTTNGFFQINDAVSVASNRFYRAVRAP